MDPERIRRDFPLYEESEGLPTAYLDNACTTLKPYPVVEAVSEYYLRFPVCGERSVHRLSNRVTQAVEASRQAVADHVGLGSPDVVFTKNATEALNVVAAAMKFEPGDVVLTTDKEHNSNFVPWIKAARDRGIVHRVVATQEDGRLDVEAFDRAVEESGGRLRLASLAHVSNVDGVAIPLAHVSRRVHDAGGLVMLDAAQSAAHGPVRVDAGGADLVALSLHKMLGPSGVGVLAAAPHAWEQLGEHTLGGGTVGQSSPGSYALLERPARYEAGLGNYAGLVAVEAALGYLNGIGFEALAAHERRLNEHATRRLGQVPGVQVHGPPAALRSSIVPFTVEGLDAHDVALYLDEAADVAVRSGAHCVHSYFQRRGLEGSVRASFHAYNTLEDVDRLVDAIEELVASIRRPRATRA